MAEGSYEYECMRAELLGVEKPDYEEFMRNKQERAAFAEEQLDTENLKEVELEDDQLGHVSGGLEELNSILQVTQRRINKFKASCGSLTNLLKFKLGQASSSEASETSSTEVACEARQAVPPVASNGDLGGGPKKSDLARALDNHVDRLDSLIDKADNAHYSMAHQNKEMKRFLN